MLGRENFDDAWHGAPTLIEAVCEISGEFCCGRIECMHASARVTCVYGREREIEKETEREKEYKKKLSHRE